QWDSTTGKFSCGLIQGTNPYFGLAMHEGTNTAAHITDLTYDAGMFNFSNTASNGTLRLDWTNGPASRSANQTISGLWTFTGGVSVSSPFELTQSASIGGNATIKGNEVLTGTFTGNSTGSNT